MRLYELSENQERDHMSKRHGQFLVLPLEGRTARDSLTLEEETLFRAAIVLTIHLRIKAEDSSEESMDAAS